jgi:NAD(P)-dependent dehydrogenase (short-subunit alcohol dehydrogenase family)
MGALDGRNAFISGGSRGIGRAIALALAADGADVAINYRRDGEAALATVREITAMGRRSSAFAASVDDADACAAMCTTVLEEFGPIDLLVHNAGIASRGQSVVKTELAEVERNWRTHTLAGFILAQHFVPGMRDADRGDVVMISSVATTHMQAGGAPYTMAKAGLEALAMTLAKEERRNGIHVNVVAPGLVETEMGRRLVKGAMGVDEIHSLDAGSPFGHVCTPEEVAAVVRGLVSDVGAYLTGIRVTVDGGTF